MLCGGFTKDPTDFKRYLTTCRSNFNKSSDPQFIIQDLKCIHYLFIWLCFHENGGIKCFAGRTFRQTSTRQEGTFSLKVYMRDSLHNKLGVYDRDECVSCQQLSRILG